MSNYFDHETERCLDCDGHFRHFPGCPDYVGEPALTLEQRVATRAEIAEIQGSNEQDHVEEDPAYWAHYGFGPVEQGYYDDDPSPYAGDYSEM